ncbi:hypothetical protein [Escherichia coli]|uniref:hypothetical protein n=1 Tax=Escherichia coli TaxID=562 RepID=UPI0013B008CF|nr:hypothetical protein [Escherichia coli]
MGSCAAPSAKGDDKFITTDYLQQCHLNYQVALENVLSAEYEVDGIFRKVAFSELELHEQKQLLIEILDKNQLYVNASDMDDSDLNISESDKAFTRSFYGME